MKNALLLLTVLMLFAPGIAPAQTADDPPRSPREHAGIIGHLCPEKWESQDCLHAVSLSNYDMVRVYAETLGQKGRKSSLEPLKNTCAAATVIGDETIPAYAYKSAYTECANSIYDISERAGVKPDPDHYQLLVAALLCLEKDRRCAGIESQLR